MDRLANKALDLVYAICLNHPKKVMALWIIGALSCLYWAQDLPNYCVFSYLPPSGTPSNDAFNAVSYYFPKFLFQDYEIIVMETPKGENIISNETNLILNEINNTLWNHVNKDYNLLVSFDTYFDANTSIMPPAIYPLYKSKFVSSDNTTMISFLSLNINGVDQDKINGFINDLENKLSSLTKQHKNYKTLALTGPMTMWNQGMIEMEDDMTSKDMIMMPFIFALIMYIVGSWKFIAIVGPVLGMVMVLSLSSFLPFGKYNVWQINPMAPSIMLFLSMALSVDYSMFLISRFSSEIRKGASVQHAVREMIKYSAHVVILSGMVLLVSYLGITFFPVAGMDTVGYAAVITIFYAVTINITFTSSSILAFPNFYGKLEVVPSCCVNCYRKCFKKSKSFDNEEYMDSNLIIQNDNENERTVTKTYDRNESSMAQAPSIGDAEQDMSHQKAVINEIPMNGHNNNNNNNINNDYTNQLSAHENAQNWYFKLTQFTTRSPWKYIVPLFVYGLMSPVIYILLTRYQYSMDFTDFFPTDSSSVNAWNQMSDKFPPSVLMPYYLLGVTNDETNENKQIWTNEFFSTMCYATNEIMRKYSISSIHFHSAMYSPNISWNGEPLNPIFYNISKTEIFCFDQNITLPKTKKQYNIVNEMKYLYQNGSNDPNINSTLGYLYFDEYMEQMISETQTASIISFLVPWNPMLQLSVQPSRDLRTLINTINNNISISKTTKFYLHNSLYWQIDSMDETYKKMPWMMCIIVGGIFLMIGLMFKSFFLPFRLFFAIVIPIAFVYGLAVGVFVIGWLDFLNWNPLHSGDGIIWMGPPVTITILMGLAMDYEIFLFSRVFEYRYKGYSTRASIILGVSNTGPIISSAGTVMAMAFFGMLLQNIVSSNQMGFLFVFGVLIDTFIVRPMLVPPILSLVDKLNWWPTKVPMKNLLDEYGNLVQNN